MPTVVLLIGLTEDSYGHGDLLFDHVITVNNVVCRRKPIGLVVNYNFMVSHCLWPTADSSRRCSASCSSPSTCEEPTPAPRIHAPPGAATQSGPYRPGL